MPRIDEVSDAQLVTSIARYSEVALAECYRRHGGAVFGLAKRVLHNPTDAEDVTQEIFLRLWNEPDRFDPARGSLRSFLLAQAHGRAVDAVRSSSSRRQRESRDALRTAEAAYDLQREVWDLAVADQVSHALGELPEEERRAIELAYFDGRTYREVAQMLNQPEGTVKSRIRNGMRRMRAVLAEAGGRGVDARCHLTRPAICWAPTRSMPSTARSAPGSRSISRPARAVGQSSTACARSRRPWATR